MPIESKNHDAGQWNSWKATDHNRVPSVEYTIHRHHTYCILLCYDRSPVVGYCVPLLPIFVCVLCRRIPPCRQIPPHCQILPRRDLKDYHLFNLLAHKSAKELLHFVKNSVFNQRISSTLTNGSPWQGCRDQGSKGCNLEHKSDVERAADNHNDLMNENNNGSGVDYDSSLTANLHNGIFSLHSS